MAGKAIPAPAERGELRRLAEGLYVVASDWSALDGSARHRGLSRAALAVVPDTVLSHVSAALLHGLPEPTRPVTKVTLTSLGEQLLTSAPDDWKRVLHGRLHRRDWTALGKYRGDFEADGLSADELAARVLAERDRERSLEALGFGVARWANRDLWGGGAGLKKSLHEARLRARASSIECLWRMDPYDPLRPWSQFTDHAGREAA